MMRKRKNKRSKNFLYLLGFFVLLLLVFVFLELDLTLDLNKEINSFEIVDRCGPSPIGQGILHEFQTEGECKLRCSNLCEVRNLKYVSHEFLVENRTCYLCNCDCK